MKFQRWWNKSNSDRIIVCKYRSKILILEPGKCKLEICLDNYNNRCEIMYERTELRKIPANYRNLRNISDSEIQKYITRIKKLLFPSDVTYIFSDRST